ncbi:hypothetical protein SGLAM104S_05634 [Streptomyces glaucescens]
MGTPSFMAPEQASGLEVTAATDVFALGQTAAFAALGRPLYGDGSAISVLYRIVHSEPDLSLLPEPLRPLLARCLTADPVERPTPAEVVEWCRQRLEADSDAGGAPVVWQDITGPEVTVPAGAGADCGDRAALDRRSATAGRTADAGGPEGTQAAHLSGHVRRCDGWRPAPGGSRLDGHGREGRAGSPGRCGCHDISHGPGRRIVRVPVGFGTGLLVGRL